jgi:branched-chain amino acid transport system permease protein
MMSDARATEGAGLAVGGTEGNAVTWLGTGTQRAGKLAWLAGLVLLIIAPFVGVYPIIIMTALCFAIYAMAFNLLLGFTGLLSFGHAAFFGGAAYVTGWLVHEQHWTPELGLLAGTLAAAWMGVGPR